MGYKAPAIHPKSYSTDCKCKYRYFSCYSDAVKHCISCPQASAAFYNGAYSEPRKVYEKKNGQC